VLHVLQHSSPLPLPALPQHSSSSPSPEPQHTGPALDHAPLPADAPPPRRRHALATDAPLRVRPPRLKLLPVMPLLRLKPDATLLETKLAQPRPLLQALL
jgi:hypothetical protein